MSAIHTCHHPRKRMIQYSETDDGLEKARRTGSPACAGMTTGFGGQEMADRDSRARLHRGGIASSGKPYVARMEWSEIRGCRQAPRPRIALCSIRATKILFLGIVGR